MSTSNLGGQHSFKAPNIALNEFLADMRRVGEGVVVGQLDGNNYWKPTSRDSLLNLINEAGLPH